MVQQSAFYTLECQWGLDRVCVRHAPPDKYKEYLLWKGSAIGECRGRLSAAKNVIAAWIPAKVVRPIVAGFRWRGACWFLGVSQSERSAIPMIHTRWSISSMSEMKRT